MLTACTLVLPLAPWGAPAPLALDRAEAARSCGSISFSGRRLRIVVLRGTSCRTAKRVARHYDRRFRAPRPWSCFLGRAGERDKISCGYGRRRRGDVRTFRHAFVGR